MKLRQEIKKLSSQLADSETALSLFPNADIHVDRWSNQRIVADLSTYKHRDQIKLELPHSCGCCPDAALLARFYLEVHDLRVYHKDMDICVGEKCYDGDIPGTNWSDKIIKAGFETFVPQIQKYFEENAPEDEEPSDCSD